MQYMPIEQETRSKKLALFLAWDYQMHLLYLGYTGEFIKRTLILLTIIGSPVWVYWWIRDMIWIAKGKINCDKKGVPLK